MCLEFAKTFRGVRLCITGVSRSDEGPHFGANYFGHDQIRMMANEVPGIVDCFDIGTWNQIALIEECDLFCSPHTGFAFVAQFVGTPCLTISGCPWAEYLFQRRTVLQRLARVLQLSGMFPPG